MAPIQQAVAVVEQHPVWNWLAIIGTALASWIAPIAGAVTIGLALLQGYIAWQKYKHWRKQIDRGDLSGRGE